MEPELAFGRDIRANIATAGAVVFINEFHEGFVSLLVHQEILFHFLLDFVEDDIFGKYKVFLFHVFVYFEDVALLAHVSNGHAVGPDFDYSQKL